MVDSRSWVGRGLKRREDPRLLRGEGCFVEDLRLDGLAEVAFLRSPHASALIRGIDVEGAREVPGVLAVVVAADVADVNRLATTPFLPVEGELRFPEQPLLAVDRVKFVGEPVVALVAETRGVALDALEAIAVDYELLEAVVDPAEAIEPGAPLVHPELGSNLAARACLEAGDVDAAFETADHCLRVHVGHGRLAAVALEPRGAVARYDAATDEYTLWLSTQSPWNARETVAQSLHAPAERIRVIAPDVGGGFGAKGTTYREEILLTALARRVGRPVRWVATRSEDLQTTTQSRASATDGEVAFDADGRIRALRTHTLADVGSYLMRNSVLPGVRLVLFLNGAYDIRHMRAEAVCAFTNTGPLGPYRGAGRPEAAFFIERAVNEVARFLSMDEAEVRRRNFIPPDTFPYTNYAGRVYDSGNYELALDRALGLIDVARTRRDIERRRAGGEVVGLGIASCIEVSGGGWESGRIVLQEDGRVLATTGSSPHGQGIPTTYAQIVADVLHAPLDAVEILHGDTALGLPGVGTFASRSLQLGGGALYQAGEQVRDQLKQVAAEYLEIAPDDLVLQDGTIGPVGAPERAEPIGEVARWRRESTGEDIAATVRFDGGETYPFGTNIALVSIDRETGRPTIERYVGVDDAGVVVNPVVVEGQIVGGLAQGVAEALFEEVVYDRDSGQLLTGTLADYGIPTINEVPTFQVERTVTPSPKNPIGAKGIGEAGAVHAPPAIANAIMDALRPFGVESLDMPFTAEKLWKAIRS